MIKRIAGIVLIVAALSNVGAVAPRPGGRLLFASMQRVTLQSTAAQAWAKQLQALRDERAHALVEKQKALDATRLELANSGGYFKGARRAELTRTAERQTADLRQLREQAQAEVQTLQRKLETEFRSDVNAVMNGIAVERDADMILNADTAVLWSRSGGDVTEEVVRRLNRQTTPK